MKLEWKHLFLFFPFLLYLLALNPYLEPSVYDDVIYLEGAKSIVTEGRYAYMGKIIRDWPPMMSICLAALYTMGFTSVLAAKIFVLSCVFVAMGLCYLILKQNQYEFPTLTYFTAMISPVLFLWGSRVMAEWPYFVFSLIFLFLLNRLENNRKSIFLIFLSGVMLAICILTRYVGITLLGAIATTIIHRLYSNKKEHKEWNLKDIYPEVLVCGIGISIFVLAWVIPIYFLQQKEAVIADYYQVDYFLQSHPLKLLNILTDTLFKINRFPFLHSFIVYTALVLANLLLLIGFVHQIRNRGFKKTDGYVVCYLLLLLNTHEIHTRYMIPIIPFLFSYFFSGIKVLGGQLPSFVPIAKLKYILIGILTSYYLIYDLHLLLLGNKTEYGGMNIWMSPTPQSFYLNRWRDLYDSAMMIKEDPKQGDIGLFDIAESKYIYYFAQRKTYDIPTSENLSFLIVNRESNDQSDAKDKIIQMLSKNWILLKETPSMNTYRRK